MATVTELLSRSRIERSSVVLCGAGDNRDVTGVALVEDIHDVAAAPAGQMIVLSRAASAQLTSYQLDIAVRLASTARAAALVLGVAPSSGTLPSTTAELAQRGELSILALADHSDLSQLLLDVHDEVAGNAAGLLTLANAAVAAIDSWQRSDDPMADLAAIVARELGIEVAVAQAGTVVGRQVAVQVDGKPHASFTFTPTDDASGAVASLVLHRAALVAERGIGDARRAADRPVTTRAGLLAELIACSPEEAGPLLRRARRSGIAVDGWHTAVHIELDNIISLTGGDELARYDVIAEAARLALQASQSGAARWHRADAGSDLVLIRNDEAEPSVSISRTVNQAAAAVVERLKEQFPALRLYCGVGGSYRGLEGLQTSTTEARAGTAAAHAAGRVDQPVAFRNLGLRRSLLQWYAMGSSRILVQRLLAPLDELGPARKEKALRTLQAHLEHPGSAADAAAALGVHRNTMNNRVKRLFELLDLDESNADHRLLLQLACRMHTV